MKFISYILTILTLGILSCNAGPSKDLAPIYIEPYYNSNPFKINVGEYSEELKNADDKQILDVAKEIKSNIDKVNIQTLFVLSNRLYDLKKKKEAAYWYYTASFRRNVFKKTAEDNRHGTEAGEMAQALDAYKKLLGEYVNGYALGDVDQNVAICKAVIADNKNMKDLSTVYPSLKFDAAKLSEAVNYAVNDREGFIKYMVDNKQKIKEQRTKTGMDNKY